MLQKGCVDVPSCSLLDQWLIPDFRAQGELTTGRALL